MSIRSEDYTRIANFPKEDSIEVGDSGVTLKEQGNDVLMTISFTDILSFRMTDSDDGDNPTSLLTINYIQSQNDRRLVKMEAKFQGAQKKMTTHYEQIKTKMAYVISARPKKLLVFKNPYGGSGNAVNIFSQLRPIFDEAGIACDEVVTTKAKDAEERIQKYDLCQYDGVVVVGGDGLLSEVVNGLVRYTQNKVGVNFNDHTLRHTPCSLPIGIIPAGTGNIYAKMLHGIREPTTAALHIVRGFRTSSSLYSIHQEGKLCAYSILVFGFGFPGDLIKSSLSKKYLGRAKYFFAVLDSILWKHDAYKIKLSFRGVLSPEQQETTQNSEGDDLKTLNGEYHAIEGFSMNFQKAENSLLPVFGEDFGKFVLIKKCSRLQHLTFYDLLHSQKPNAYDLSYIDCVNAELCRIELLEPDLLHRRNMYLNYDGELLPITSNIVDIRLQPQIVSFFGG